MKQELLNLLEHLSSPPVFSGVRVVRALVFCVVFCRLSCVLLCVFILFWPLYCLSLGLQLLSTLLVFSNFSIQVIIVESKGCTFYFAQNLTKIQW